MSDKIAAMILLLKAEFEKMERIDPCSEKVLKIRDVLAKMEKADLQRIIDAKIKFLDIMAKTEIRKREGK